MVKNVLRISFFLKMFSSLRKIKIQKMRVLELKDPTKDIIAVSILMPITAKNNEVMQIIVHREKVSDWAH